MNGNGPTAVKRPRMEGRPATPATPSTSGTPQPPSASQTGSAASTPKPYQSTTSNAASSITLPTTTTPPAWATAAQNPITLDPALASMPSPTAAGPSSMPNPTATFSRFLPQQQYPPGLPPTSPALSYPSASSPAPPTASTPTTTSYPAYSQYTPAGFVRTLPPSTYTPYHQQTSYHYTPAPTSAPVLPQQAAAPAPPNPLDSSDPNELNDVLGSAGVDVRAEQDALNRARDFYQGQNAATATRVDRSRRQAFIDPHILGPTIRSIASNHNVAKVPEESINYAALALKERLLSLIRVSLQARNHRVNSTVTRPPGMYSDGSSPMWSHGIKRDVRKQLLAIEKVEREEEARIRRERHERLENPGGATAGTSGTGGDSGAENGDSGKKRKRVKELGPGVRDKMMSEEVRKKFVDDVASRAVGGGTKKYAWMTSTTLPGAMSTPASTPKPNVAPSAMMNGASTPYPRPTPLTGASSGWMRATPQALRRGADDEDGARSLTLLDVEFAIDREKGHGGGRGAARGW